MRGAHPDEMEIEGAQTMLSTAVSLERIPTAVWVVATVVILVGTMMSGGPGPSGGRARDGTDSEACRQSRRQRGRRGRLY